MRAQDGAFVEEPVELEVGGAAGALTERPFRAAVVLGLHRTQPANRVDRGGERLADQALGAQASGSEVGYVRGQESHG